MIRKARAIKRTDGFDSKTEAEYAQVLQKRLYAGQIAAYKHHGVTLRLAQNTRYTPDFMVVTNDGYIELHEVKGFWRDDARVKIKVAADAYPWFAFVVIEKCKKTKQLVETERL